MQYVTAVVTWIFTLPSPVLVGLIMGTICLVFGGGFKNALRSACLFAIGITGINLVMNYCVGQMQSISTALSQRLGISLNVVDGGYAIVNGMALYPGFFICLLAILLINVAFILLKWTNTMWSDINNTWHGVVIGAFVWAQTGNVVVSILVGIVTLVLMMKLADWTAPTFQEFNNIDNVSVIATSATIPGLFAFLVMKVINRIPFLKKINASSEDIKEKFGIFGEVMVIGMIVGILLGILAGYSLAGILTIGVVMSATMALFPKMAALLCEGIVPLSMTITAFMKKRFGDRKLNVACDPAILLGDPSVMATFIIMAPISIAISLLVPGVAFVPIASLAGMPYWIGGVTPYTKGNVVHNVIIMTLYVVMASLIASSMADVITNMALLTGQFTDVIKSGTKVTFWDEGSSIIGFAFRKLFDLLGMSTIG
ncbi:PTS transporter subunit IIC [Clostridium sp. KNHs216]|uniref:PTS transporter subunit IIC n=1 Tax=Clostridium sp. KNHs216 TaxID=1550235 RepID=UPI00114FB1B2|nr:PTS transporter subunit IIC [Clostridium sp. KNHs216]TQI68929.1 PTS system galactitol-specific IIC component [Clostridium sp. KNHs216]